VCGVFAIEMKSHICLSFCVISLYICCILFIFNSVASFCRNRAMQIRLYSSTVCQTVWSCWTHVGHLRCTCATEFAGPCNLSRSNTYFLFI
jgi:hypothetical protein